MNLEEQQAVSHAAMMMNLIGLSNVRPTGHLQPRKVINAAQYKIINLFKTLFFFFCSSVFTSVCAVNVWPKTTLLLPVWPKDTKRSDIPESRTVGEVREAHHKTTNTTWFHSCEVSKVVKVTEQGSRKLVVQVWGRPCENKYLMCIVLKHECWRMKTF